MHLRSIALSLAAVLTFRATARAAEPPTGKSFLPASEISRLIVDRLDITTFRNSLGPRRQPGMRHFADLGLKPTKISDSAIEFDEAGFSHTIAVLERGDKNRDGLEDLVIQIAEKASKGSYKDSQKLLVTRFSETGDLIAIAFAP